ncbi:PREDICTED: nurim homolog [Atta cephalotes]|uniref:Nuclear envelope membrane protein n=1 Tax=Atta cephalotes TaxID=12957 RepID=A0A158NSJ8_ATTCE|nr:PREDICTED: nurim homolog [Atta cephalotes]
MISNILNVIVGASSFIYTCYILCRLTYFLSSHEDNENLHTVLDDNADKSTLWSLLTDMLLITTFIFQHSIMTNELTKLTFCRLNIEYLSRSIYNVCSSASLHFLINKWQQTPVTIWKLKTSNKTIWIIFSSLHVFAWSIIYSGCIMMDIAELCGLKQIWYKISKKNSPLDRKSRELCRYMRHMRHPSFVGFVIILWIYPVMSADRVLLGTILTMYMALLWTLDFEDYNYHIRYFRQKQIELS